MSTSPAVDIDLPVMFDATRPDDQRAGCLEAFELLLKASETMATRRNHPNLILIKAMHGVLVELCAIMLRGAADYELQERWVEAMRSPDIHMIGLHMVIDGYIVIISELSE